MDGAQALECLSSSLDNTKMLTSVSAAAASSSTIALSLKIIDASPPQTAAELALSERIKTRRMAVALAALLEGATAAALDASPYFVRDSERQREWMLRWAINTCQDELCDTARAHHWELMWQSLMHRAMRTWTSHALLGAAAESLSAAGEAFLHTIHLARTRRAWRRWPHRRSRLASARQLFLAWALLCERG